MTGIVLKVSAMKRGNALTETKPAESILSFHDLHFFYDAQNRPAVVIYNGTAYAYVKNLQGDIIAILDTNGNVVVQYAYDAWGKPIATTGSMASTLGVINPFRYRGYVYDQETGLYYLRSRYYNATWSRFVNADIILDSGCTQSLRHNVFTYCQNTPVQCSDTSGMDSSVDPLTYENDGIVDLDGYGMGGGYWVQIPNSAVWSSLWSSPLYEGHWIAGFSPTAYTVVAESTGSNRSNSSGSGNSSGIATSTFLPNHFYTAKAPLQYTPCSKIVHWRESSDSHVFEKSIVCYNAQGKQWLRIDFTDHNRGDHSNPHMHMRIYNNRNNEGEKVRINLWNGE